MRSMGTRISAAASVILLLLFVAFDERLEAVEAHGPEFLPLPEPTLGFFERPRFEGNDVRAADLSALQQPCVLEHLHVLGCAGEAHRERLRQFADRFVAECET